jgi:hypothetical protein
LLRELPDKGIHTFVSHGPHPYKRHWATSFAPVKNIYLFRQTPLGILSRLIRFKLMPRLGQIPAREWDEANK